MLRTWTNWQDSFTALNFQRIYSQTFIIKLTNPIYGKLININSYNQWFIIELKKSQRIKAAKNICLILHYSRRKKQSEKYHTINLKFKKKKNIHIYFIRIFISI